jgi:hypothetical protein
MGYGQDKDPVTLQRKVREDKRVVEHVDPPARIVRERNRLERSLSSWLRFFLPVSFQDEWSDDHRKILKIIEAAINDGGLFAEAMPRGHGKSTIVKGTALYAVLTGRRKYVVSIAATAELAQAVVDFVRKQIMENDLLHQHYPHVTEYARQTEGKAINARYQLRADHKTSGIQWSKTTLVLPEVLNPKTGKGYPSNGAILEAHGLTGAIRGKWKDSKTGKVIRPDFAILDDPQSRESAESISQCAMRERIITGDVLGLAGPRKKIAAVMPCTIIRRGDLADRFLDHKTHPEWQGETCRLVYKWPTAQDTLWREYAAIYKAQANEDGGAVKATQFYVAHRAAMDEGSEVSWASRVRDGEVSAIQTAENLLIESGDQFWAEYQNDPRDVANAMYELNEQIVCSHATDMPHLHLPDMTSVFVGMVDVNRAKGGLHWCLAGYDQTMTGHSPAYGIYPDHGDLWEKNSNEQQIHVAIFRGLTELCNRIQATAFMRGGVAIHPQLVMVDCGYMADAVQRFAQSARYSFRVIPSIGRDAKQYRVKKDTLVGQPYENCHVQRAQKLGHGPYVMFHSDYWRETAQRAFLGAPGQRGGFTLYAGRHRDFAEQVCAEKLVHKGDIGGGLRWEWARQPGSQWDWGDALTGCWVAAAVSGLSASGTPVIRRRYVETRKAKVAEE